MKYILTVLIFFCQPKIQKIQIKSENSDFFYFTEKSRSIVLSDCIFLFFGVIIFFGNAGE